MIANYIKNKIIPPPLEFEIVLVLIEVFTLNLTQIFIIIILIIEVLKVFKQIHISKRENQTAIDYKKISKKMKKNQIILMKKY